MARRKQSLSLLPLRFSLHNTSDSPGTCITTGLESVIIKASQRLPERPESFRALALPARELRLALQVSRRENSAEKG